MAGHMKLQIWKEAAHEHINGSGDVRPLSQFDADELGDLVSPDVWWGEYSAPGYMDKTDACGPFSTAVEAACETFSLYGEISDDDEDHATADEMEFVGVLVATGLSQEEAEEIARKTIG